MTNETNKTTTQAEETMNEEATVEMESHVVQLPAEQKKGGFLRELSIGAKIGAGLVIGGVLLGAGFLIKNVFFGGKDGADAPIEVEGTVSEPIDG